MSAPIGFIEQSQCPDSEMVPEDTNYGAGGHSRHFDQLEKSIEIDLLMTILNDLTNCILSFYVIFF